MQPFAPAVVSCVGGSAVDEDLVAMAIFAGMMVFLFAILGGAIYSAHRKTRMRHEERRMMIERGMVPPEDPPEASRGKTPRVLTPDDYLRRGLILLFLGIGLVVAPMLLLDMGPGRFGSAAAASGIVIGLLGVGNLAYSRVGRRGEHGPPAAHDRAAP